MKEIRKFDAQITGLTHDETGNYYYQFVDILDENQRKMTVPEWSILGFCVPFDSMMDSKKQHLEVGSIIELREMSNGHFYPSPIYPKKTSNFGCYKKGKMDPVSLYENVTLISDFSLEELYSCFLERAKEFSSEEIMNVMSHRFTRTENEQIDYLKKLLGITILKFTQESQTEEFKSSFLHPAGPKANDKALQYKEIARELTSMGNSGVESSVWIGVANSGEIVGIESELINSNFSKRCDFEADFRNHMIQLINDTNFVSSIVMKWYSTNDRKLVCQLLVPQWKGNLLFVNGNELLVRSAASKQTLRNQSLVDFILQRCA